MEKHFDVRRWLFEQSYQVPQKVVITNERSQVIRATLASIADRDWLDEGLGIAGGT